MSAATEILATLHAAGLRLTPRGEHVSVAPPDRVTPELRELILANKPAILDALDDDRRHCAACLNLHGRRCRTTGLAVLDDLPRRCLDYRPFTDDADPRTGRERWPWMVGGAETPRVCRERNC